MYRTLDIKLNNVKEHMNLESDQTHFKGKLNLCIECTVASVLIQVHREPSRQESN